jgi:hypothetical protein
MESWRSADIGDDALKELSRMIVDFAREVGLPEDQDEALVRLVISAYRAGKADGAMESLAFLSPTDKELLS